MAGKDGSVQLSAVVEVWESAAVGAFNPFVLGADLIVDGVVGGYAGCACATAALLAGRLEGFGLRPHGTRTSGHHELN
jgi:hypothetical protein